MSDFDLNLVRTFVLLYDCRSVTLAAEALHVTQPTVSYNLRKLRRRWGDELFSRSGQGLVPTAVAERLYEPLRRALTDIDEATTGTTTFDPVTMPARFTVALTDLGELTLLPKLVVAARERAPQVSFVVRPLEIRDAERQIGRGELDALLATPVMKSQRITRIPLFTDRYVAIVAADHPRIHHPELSFTDLAAEQHATVFGPSGHTEPRSMLEAHGLLKQVALEVTRFSMLPYLVEQTDLVAIVPRHPAEVFASSHRIRIAQLPLDIDPIEVAVYTRPSSMRTPAQQWLISFMCQVLRQRNAAPPQRLGLAAG